MSAEEKWKSKYFNHLRDYEALEEACEARDDLLRKAINRLSITAKGIHPRLDTVLGQLQQHCKQKKDDKLAESLNRLGDILNELDESSEEVHWQQFVRLLLDKLPQSEPQQVAVAGLLHELPKLELDAALSAISTLLQEWLKPQDAPASNCLEPSELLENLISRVTVTFGSNAALQNLRTEIAEAQDNWPAYLDKIIAQIGLQIRLLHQDKARLETLILDVGQQLKDISSLLEQEFLGHQLGRQQTAKLQSAMDNNVANLQNALSAGGDIDQLKSALELNINKIKVDLKDFVEGDNQRFQDAEQRNQQLQQQLSQMQKESSELRQQLLENRKKLMLDTLTGVRSRLAYDEIMDQEFARYGRYQEVFCYALFDIDYFKKINDSYGHNAGDNALRIVASMMNKNIRKTDFLFRIGGEEFALLLPKTKIENARDLVEKIRQSVGQAEFHYKGIRVNISMSAGLTSIKAGDDISSIYQRADKGLYQAKSNGRDQMVVV